MSDDKWPELVANPLPLPAGWVDYVEDPMTPQQRIVRCPIGAAPAWVQRKHANRDPEGAA